jgi:glycosyltransferase involved in cell wall biosynthesis
MNKIAIAMSVYRSDSTNFVKQAIESILEQTYQHFVLFIQVDGLVSEELKELLFSYINSDKVDITFHSDNLGLAQRLNDTIESVISDNSFDFLARMDADDISLQERFDCQVEFLKKNPDIGVVGSDVIEIDESNNHLFYKKMKPDHFSLEKNIIKRCPLNHPSVMIRLSVFRESKLRYKSELSNTQDYYLWVDMLVCNVKFANINKPLLYFRIDDKFHSRRGFKKALNDFNSRVYAFRELGCYSISNFVHVIKLVALRLSPTFIKKMVYERLR